MACKHVEEVCASLSDQPQMSEIFLLIPEEGKQLCKRLQCQPLDFNPTGVLSYLLAYRLNRAWQTVSREEECHDGDEIIFEPKQTKQSNLLSLLAFFR